MKMKRTANTQNKDKVCDSGQDNCYERWQKMLKMLINGFCHSTRIYETRRHAWQNNVVKQKDPGSVDLGRLDVLQAQFRTRAAQYFALPSGFALNISTAMTVRIGRFRLPR